MLKYLGISLVVAVMWGISTDIAVMAQKLPQPSQLGAEEFLGAEVGAIIGGALGLGVVHTSCDSLGFESACASLRWLNSTLANGRSRPFKIDFNVVEPAFRTINMGRGLGALTGVVLVSWIRGVEGNILAAYLATNLWFFASTVVPHIAVPGAPALVATVAYNWGATMKPQKKQPATLSWHLPLLAGRF